MKQTGTIRIVSDNPKYSKFIQWSKEEALAFLNTLDSIALDIETSGLNAHKDIIYLVQLGNADIQVVIDALTIDIVFFKKLLETKELVIQNAQFGLQFLFKKDIQVTKIHDAMLVESVLYGGYNNKADLANITTLLDASIANKYITRRFSLNALTTKYCNITLDRNIYSIITSIGINNTVIEYVADNVKYMHAIKEQQLAAYKNHQIVYKVDGNLIDLENKVAIVLAKMLFNGVLVDKEKYKNTVIDEVNTVIIESIKELDNNILNDSRFKKWHAYQLDLFSTIKSTGINWNSNVVKLEILKEIDANIESTGTPVLRKHVKAHPIIANLVSYSKSKKLQSSFGEALLEHIDSSTGRIHSNIQQILSTGRISMSNPNLLQIPSKGKLGKVIRSCFIPRDGYDVVGGDYSSLTN